MARKFFVGGNWKCNGSVKGLQSLIDTFNSAKLPHKDAVEVVVAPTALHIGFTKEKLTQDIQVAAQNCWVKGSGAYTGEIRLRHSMGDSWTLRAAQLAAGDKSGLLAKLQTGRGNEILIDVVADKTSYALGKGLSVILCVGETLDEREANKAEEVIAGQLQPVSKGVSGWDHIVIAYEPVWAIGTGKVASPEQAQAIHAFIRSWLGDNVSKDVADSTRIIYGGSVSASNSQQLAQEQDIDGFLVGGASLKPDFVDIIKAAESR